MDSRRRTLVSDGPAGNAGASSSSAIPLPSSAMKRPAVRSTATQGSRLSMAPQPYATSTRPSLMGGSVMGASSIGSNGSHEPHSARRSILPGRMGDINSMSTRAETGAFGRTPQTSKHLASTRRSSIFASAGGRMSIMPSYAAVGTIKDPRPIRDRTFQSDCHTNIQEFLARRKVQLALTPKWLSSPTQRDFQNVFRYLADELVGPGFPWGKKFEDDCIAIMRDLRYPVMDAVGKTALTAPGSPNAWPNVLAMLNWMVDLCKAQEHCDDSDVVSDPLLCPASELPVDHPQIEDRLLWDFCAKTYREWFEDGAEEFPQAERELEEAFERIVSASVDECERLETEVNKRDVELRQLQAQEPPLKKLEEEYLQLMSDKTKFLAFIDLHRQKADKMKQNIANALAAKAENARNISAARNELADTEAAVAAQNLSPDEVNRMNHEREALSRNLDELRIKIGEAHTFACEQEMAVTKSMDRFDQLLQDYTALGHQIGTMSTGVEDLQPEFQAVEFAFELDLGAESLNDIRDEGHAQVQVIRPALQSYCEHFRRQVRQLQDDAIALDDENDRVAQDVERQREDVLRREMRFKLVHDQAEEAKVQMQNEAAETNRTVSKLESEVSAMSTASQQGVFSTQSQLESTKIEFEELRHRTQALQEGIVTQIMSQIDVVIKAKEHTANSLKGMRSFAEQAQ